MLRLLPPLLQILSDLKFSHIERTDHVPTARPYRIKLPLNMVSCAVSVIALPDMQFMWRGPFPSVSVNATIPSGSVMAPRLSVNMKCQFAPVVPSH